MCDVIEMTARIAKLSQSGFNNRLKLFIPKGIGSLRTFNRRIESLVDDTYDVINEIGEAEYAVLQEPLDLLISVVSDFLLAYKKRYNGNQDAEDLEGMLSYLQELRSDIQRFRLPSPQNQAWTKKLDSISNLMRSHRV